MQSWHFTIQRQLAKDLLFELAYVGNRGVKLMILGDVNQARPQAPNENSTLNSRRPYLAFRRSRDLLRRRVIDIYNAFQSKLEKRFSGGFYFLNSFTWSKLIDNSSGHLEAYNGDNSRVNFLDLENDKGVGSYNQPFNNTTTVVYAAALRQGPEVRLQRQPHPDRADRRLAGDVHQHDVERSAGEPHLQSGIALPGEQLSDVPADPVGRSDGARAAQRNIDNYFNKANVIVPVDPLNPNPFGNAGRNTVRSYAIYQTDLGLHKDFPLWSEVRKLEIPLGVFQPDEQDEFPGAELDREQQRVRHDPQHLPGASDSDGDEVRLLGSRL